MHHEVWTAILGSCHKWRNLKVTTVTHDQLEVSLGLSSIGPGARIQQYMTGNAPKEDDDDGLDLMSLPDAMKSEAALARDVNHRGHVWQQAAATAAVPNQQQELDSGERRLNELGYKQELRRELVSE
jgi:hypothetical protein